MLKILNYNERELKKLNKIVDKIIDLEASYQEATDEFIKTESMKLRNKVMNGESLDQLLVEGFALCKEVIRRVLGKKLYRVQLIGGIVIHQGRIAEMKTGEGKTLTEVCPAYLNALSNKGVHIATVNDYLASRDMKEMENVFKYLGLSVGIVGEKSTEEERKSAYNCDITYITHNELGFDFLRDNIAIDSELKVQRELNFVIIDEIDFILIDEARIPLIISENSMESVDKYTEIDKFIRTLNSNSYEKNIKENTIVLTKIGIEKVEEYFNIDNIAGVEHSEITHHISQALRAHYMMNKDKEYIVENNEILIINESTGRIADGQRFSEGLHQAIEAKENVDINPESITLATITYQNLFREYKKISGMTGTAKTEENEFREIYSLDVVQIPTNRPIVRVDYEDKIFISEEEKNRHIIKDIIETNKIGRPVLVCTQSVEKSEIIGRKLEEKNIRYRLLNAKSNNIEAEIISHAGRLGQITIATNIAGRGTDIKINDEVNDIGGLKVIGCERGYSKRIDNQLIGRSGRQGDNGESQFYVSLDDDLLKNFGFNKLKEKLTKKGMKDFDVLNNKYIKEQVGKAQKIVEGIHFNERKEIIKYDDILNKQRKIIFNQRQMVLHGEDLSKYIKSMINEIIDEIVKDILNQNNYDEEDFDFSLEVKEKILIDIFSILLKEYINMENDYIEYEIIEQSKNLDELKNNLDELFFGVIQNKIRRNIEYFEVNQKIILLRIIDEFWRNHINEMKELRKKILNVAYKQQDPFQVYQLEGSKLFTILVDKIRRTYIKEIIKI